MYPNTTATQVKCGKCSQWQRPVYHGSPDEVRACYAGTLAKPVTETPRPGTRSAARVQHPATDRQIDYLKGLAEKRDYSTASADTKAAVQHVLDGGSLTYRDARRVLDEMVLMPAKPRDEQPRGEGGSVYVELTELLAKVPNGGYAVEVDGKTHFYVVKNAKTPTGRKFRTVRERASDTLHKMYKNQQVAALRAIEAAGQEAARMMYSERLGACWKCTRTLTDDTGNPYRPYGLGPDCGPKVMGG